MPKDIVLASTRTGSFNRAYESLMARRDLVHRFVAYDREPSTLPYTFGGHASGLTKMLRKGHKDVKLADEEWERLVTWIDANALYYGTFDPELQARQQAGERIDSPGLP